MFLLQMIILIRHGFIFLKSKDEVFSKFKEFKALIENHTEKNIKTFRQIMVENSLQMNSKSYVKNQGLRGSCPLLTIHNRMGLQKGRIEPSWKLQEQCFMIKIFLCIYGQKQLEQQCMYRIVIHIEYSRTRILNNSSLARNQKSAISEYSVVPCTYIFQKRREQNQILQERRAYLWVTLKARRLTEFTFQDTRILTSVGM